MLKIAAADQPWLEQMVLGERRRLASLHKAALTEASVKTAAFNIDAPELDQRDLETVNEAVEFLEEQHPEQDPQEISSQVHEAFEHGMTITDLITAVSAMSGGMAGDMTGGDVFDNSDQFAHVSAKKKAESAPKVHDDEGSPNDPHGYAVESHEGDENYKTVLAAKKKGFTENTKNPNPPDSYAVESHQGEKGYENSLDADPHHAPKAAVRKKATEVPTALDPKGGNHDPNEQGGYAVESHEKAMKALAAQVARMTKLEEAPGFSVKSNPNGPIND